VFGVDPAWHGTRTELSFLNSMKMKMSILLGVVQMNAGIILSYFNQRYFADGLSTVCEFIPQVTGRGALRLGSLQLLVAAGACMYGPLVAVVVHKGTRRAANMGTWHFSSPYAPWDPHLVFLPADDLHERPVWLPVHPDRHEVGHRLHRRPVPHPHLHVPLGEC
jgi:hypothetical protein